MELWTYKITQSEKGNLIVNGDRGPPFVRLRPPSSRFRVCSFALQLHFTSEMTEPTRRSTRIKVPSKRKSLAQSSFEARERQSEDQDNSNENENEGCSQGALCTLLPRDRSLIEMNVVGSKSNSAQRGQAEEEWKVETEENDSGCVSEGPSHGKGPVVLKNTSDTVCQSSSAAPRNECEEAQRQQVRRSFQRKLKTKARQDSKSGDVI